MKREIITLSIIALLLFPIILAQEQEIPTNNEKPKEVQATEEKENPLEKSNKILSKEITISEDLEIPARVIFGLTEEDKIDLQLFIVLICVWTFLFLIIHNLVQFFPSFEGGTSWLGAIIITLLISITGSIKSVTIFFFDLANIFSILEKWGPLKLGLSIIVIFGIFYASNIILGIIKETVIVGKSVRDGMVAGAELAKLKAMSEIGKIK